MQKLLVIVLAVGANMVFQWFAHVSSKVPDAGQIFGMNYNSQMASSTIATAKYLVILFVANVVVAYAAKSGVQAFDSFLTYILIYVAAAPVAVLIYNALFLKENVNWLHLLGILLIIAGSMFIAANKEILESLGSIKS